MTRSVRNGCIIYKSDDKNLEIYWEMSGVPEYDMLLAPVDLREWKYPKDEKIPRNKHMEILHKLRDWLRDQRLKSDIDLPSRVEFADKPCGWVECNQQQVKGSAYCLDHLNEILLRK